MRSTQTKRHLKENPVANIYFFNELSIHMVFAEDGYSFTYNSIVNVNYGLLRYYNHKFSQNISWGNKECSAHGKLLFGTWERNSNFKGFIENSGLNVTWGCL